MMPQAASRRHNQPDPSRLPRKMCFARPAPLSPQIVERLEYMYIIFEKRESGCTFIYVVC
jgi:hypothetical protein